MVIDLNEYAEGAVLLTDLEEAIVGVVEEFGNGPRVLYSKSKIIEILQRDGMTESEAEEYYEFNILGLHAGDQNAVFLDRSITPIKKEKTWEYVAN